jgi:hypothetical protein
LSDGADAWQRLLDELRPSATTSRMQPAMPFVYASKLFRSAVVGPGWALVPYVVFIDPLLNRLSADPSGVTGLARAIEEIGERLSSPLGSPCERQTTTNCSPRNGWWRPSMRR